MAKKQTSQTDAEAIAALEAEGLTTSDAQSAVDAAKQPTRRRGQRRTPAEKVAAVKAANRAPCLCGCGETPKGKKAKFLPGHDARHHAAQKAAGQKPTYKLSAEARAKNAARIRAHRAARSGTTVS